MIGSVGTALAGLVALVLSTAAFFKLGDRSGATKNFVSMGFVRDPSSRRAGLLFGFVVGAELLVALVLIVFPPLGAALGLVLLGIFTAVLFRIKRTRPAVRCACFGSASQRPIGLSTFVRNGLLLVALLPAAVRLGSRSTLWPQWELGAVFVVTGAALEGLVLIQLTMSFEDMRTSSTLSPTRSSQSVSQSVSQSHVHSS